ncbi:elongation factor Ts [Chloroflexota bacterium]
MDIPTDKLKELREQTGAGIMACRNALIEAEVDMEKALQIIKEQSLFIVEKRKERATSQGLVESYVHPGGRIGAMVELNCETDFVARTDEFKELAHNLAMQIAAMTPEYISAEDIAEVEDLDTQAVCLLHQAYIRDPNLTIQDLINEAVAKVGENIRISRFARFELGDE